MRYIWIISYIYRIPSAILHPLKVLRPSLPPDPPHARHRHFLSFLKLIYPGSVLTARGFTDRYREFGIF